MKRVAAILPLVLAAQALGQDAPGTTSHPFLKGWIAEILYADLDGAEKVYKEAWTQQDLPNFQSELAGLRLWEMTFLVPDRLKYRGQLRNRSIYASGISGKVVHALDGLTPKFDAALKADDHEALSALRQEVRKLVTEAGSSVTTIRSTVHRIVPRFRGEATTSFDAVLENLKRTRRDALQAKDHAKAYEIWKQMQRHSFTRQRTASIRLRAKRYVEMTRLHLSGQHERAQGMERILSGRRITNSVNTLRSRIAGLKGTEELAEQVKLTQENLQKWLAGRRSVPAEERAILTALQARLAALAQAEKHEEALQLAAQVPYRRVLFRPRKR